MIRIFAGAAVLLVAAATTVQAQVPVSLELRGGGAFATQDVGTADLKPGFGFDGTVRVQLLRQVGVYGAWSFNSFVMDKPFNGVKYDLEDTGYQFGVHIAQPLFRDIAGIVHGGGVYRHLEFENNAGDIIADTGHELGWEAGAGLNVPLARNIALMPGVRYRSFSGDVTIGNVTTPVDMRYVMAELGLSWTLGAAGRSAAALGR
jgi:opacity protein-like surface antigen